MRPAEPEEKSGSVQTRAERFAHAKVVRRRVPRSVHAYWEPANREDPVAIVERSDAGLLPNLLPVRYARMAAGPFAFYRGTASIMASDLAQTPTTPLRVQLCGDAHLQNFGAYGSPERNLVFDVNDFDETLPGPFDWDLKRLAVSVVLAGREIGMRPRECERAVAATIGAYRERMLKFARRSPLAVWYSRIDARGLLGKPANADHLLPKITAVVDGARRFIDDPPLIYHAPKDDPIEERAHEILTLYRRALRDDVRALFDRYRLVDAAIKVVGIGSVGTICDVLLFMTEDGEPLILQMKEARRSVFAPFAGASRFENQGQRVVTGQRLMQAASDILLGWTRDHRERDFYVRQLRDMKVSAKIDAMRASDLESYAQTCARALARAHARSGDAATIAGYVGSSNRLDRALVTFARLYADQVKSDFAAFTEALRGGRLSNAQA